MKPLDHFTVPPNSEPPRSGYFYKLKLKYGEFLESLSTNRKKIFRAALAHYIANEPVWSEAGNSISLMEVCIESAGVDWDIWDEDPTLCNYIQESQELDSLAMEWLIRALSHYILDDDD